jgi:hypothetical protein
MCSSPPVEGPVYAVLPWRAVTAPEPDSPEDSRRDQLLRSHQEVGDLEEGLAHDRVFAAARCSRDRYALNSFTGMVRLPSTAGKRRSAPTVMFPGTSMIFTGPRKNRFARPSVPDFKHVSYQRCGCRKPCPRRSCGTFVLVEDAAETITSTDVEARDRVRIGDRLRQRM